MSPLQYMRKFGVVEVASDVYRVDERPLTDVELDGAVPDADGVLRKPVRLDSAPPLVGEAGSVGPRARGRLAHVRLADAVPQARGLPHRDARLGLAGARDAGLHREPRQPPPDRPGPRRVRAHADVPAAHADPHPLGQRQVPQRDQQHPSAVDEREGRRPARPDDRRPRPGATRIGHFVVKVWATEGIRPGVVALSHHMGRWRLRDGEGSRWVTGLVDLDHSDGVWTMRQKQGVKPFYSRRQGQRPDLLGRPRRAPEPDLPGAARPVVRHALLAAEGDARAGAARGTGTATSSSTRTSRARSTPSGWPRPGPRSGRTASAARSSSCGRSSRSGRAFRT